MTKTLTYLQARRFYDRFGAKQDKQGWYEDAAVAAMCELAAFEEAEAVLEFGCGTGKLALRLLETKLAPCSRYLGLDLSRTMVELARARLQAFDDRAEIRQTDGQVTIGAIDGGFDRFVACYVLDLLSPEDTATLLAEARRVLAPGGLLCIAGLAHGDTFVSKRVSIVWSWLYARSPKLVGGCRPVDVRAQVSATDWIIRRRQIVRAFGVPSEVLVAERR